MLFISFNASCEKKGKINQENCKWYAHMCLSNAFVFFSSTLCMRECRRISHVEWIDFLVLINSLPYFSIQVQKIYTQWKMGKCINKNIKHEQWLSWIVAYIWVDGWVSISLNSLSNKKYLCMGSASSPSFLCSNSIRLPIPKLETMRIMGNGQIYNQFVYTFSFRCYIGWSALYANCIHSIRLCNLYVWIILIYSTV